MAVSKHKRSIFLDNQPFTVKSYLRSTTDDLVARFGSAEQGQTNLDLLKALTQKSYRGGMFQRVFDDPEKVSTITNAYFNEIDENLYPTPNWPAITKTIDMGPNGVDSWCFMKGYFYITFKAINSPNANKNRLYKIDAATGAETAVALPAVLENSTYRITLCTFSQNIYIGAQTAVGATATDHRYDGVTTFTNMNSGICQYIEFLGRLYGENSAGELYLCSTPAGTPSFTKIDDDGIYPEAGQTYFQSIAFFNGAVYIGKRHGLYRFDGVSLTRVLDYRSAPSLNNFKCMAVFNGRLYYNIGNLLYEFDGINIVKLQYFSAGYAINDLVGGTDRLWISVTIDTGVTFTDKFVSGTPVYHHSVFAYNGIGFYEYRAFTPDILISYMRIPLIPVAGKVFAFTPDISLPGGSPSSNGYNMYTLTLANEFTVTNASGGFVVTSSELDCDYPSVAKVVNGIMVDYAGLTAGEGSFKLELQYLVNGVWSSWSEVWNTDNVAANGATNDYLLHEQVKVDTSPTLATVPLIFTKLRTRITCTITDSTPTTLPYLANSTVRYTIQPSQRFKWLLTLQIDGVDSRGITTPKLSDGAREVRLASQLRKLIYDAYRSKMPILFYDFDYTEVKALGTPLILKGTDFIGAGDTIAVQDAVAEAEPWINRRVDSVVYDDVDNETEATLALFGYRAGIGGSANTTLQANAQVRRSYAVYIKAVRNERYIIDPNSINDNNGNQGYSDAQSDLVVELVQI